MAETNDAFYAKAHQALCRGYGSDSRFREHQFEAIAALVQNKERLLLVQRTGWGKSVVYFIATRLLRDQGRGPTIIVSPLLALMRDQQRNAAKLGIISATMNSSNREEWTTVTRQIANDDIDLLLISPERFRNNVFRQDVLPLLWRNPGLLVIDEAHCISDWGHDFRPDYRRLSRLVDLLPAGVPVLATTATANDRVTKDVAAQLGDGLSIIRGSLDRTSLRLYALKLPGKAQRLVWLAKCLKQLPGSGIVYALTVKDVLLICDWLKDQGIDARPYTGDSDRHARVEIEEALLANQLKVVCATKALGMGFDKPDLAFVIHFQSPNSVVAYYQEVGRAGRALDVAQGILLAGSEDKDIWDYFLSTSLPQGEDVQKVMTALAGSLVGATLTEIMGRANLRQGRLKQLLTILEVEGAVERNGNKYQRSLKEWPFDQQRFEFVRERRLQEQKEMLQYVELAECRMAFIRKRLDDRAEPCGRCDVCTGVKIQLTVQPAEVAVAQRFIQGRTVRIAPRQKWAGARGAGAIELDRRLEEGRSLTRFDDSGTGLVVLQHKREQRELPLEIVEAFAQMIKQWAPAPAPTWITFVPTLNESRQFVPRLAQSLGEKLRLPVYPVIKKLRTTQPQKLMENSPQQVNNVLGAYEINRKPAGEPVLLVDDVIDSRWTVTVIGDLLRQAGSGPVYPVSLIGPESDQETES